MEKIKINEKIFQREKSKKNVDRNLNFLAKGKQYPTKLRCLINEREDISKKLWDRCLVCQPA